MSEPNIQRKTTESKLTDPSIQRKTSDTKLTTPSIQRTATGSRGSLLSYVPTKRREAQQEAKGMGIDTKGLSTREVKEAISVKKEAQEELASFIKDVVKDLPRNMNVAGDAGAAQVQNKGFNEQPTKLIAQSKANNNARQQSELVFYCWKDGVAGTVPVVTRGFTPLE